MVDNCKRGKIANKNRRQQIVDFSGIRYKNITPTDIDGFFEIQNKVFVFIELKLEGTELLRGQILAFERIIDALKYPSIFIIADHNILDTEREIPAHQCIVRRYKTNKWHLPKEQITLKELIDKFLLHHGLDNYVS